MKTKLAEALALCVVACNECHDACLREKMVDMMAECIRRDKDCAVVCGAALELLHADSFALERMLSLCADMCDHCAVECEKHPYSHCKECAKVCRECAKACRGHKK